MLDVVIDGDNRTTGRRIVLLSGRAGFRVSELNPLPRVSASIEASRDDAPAVRGDVEDAVQEGLGRVLPGKHESGYEPRPLILRTDAFVAVSYEKAASIQ